MQLLSETLQADKKLKLPETLEPDSRLQEAELTAVEKLLASCTKEEILSFDAIYPADVMEGSKKVGEGAFGEVFLLGSETGTSLSTERTRPQLRICFQR